MKITTEEITPKVAERVAAKLPISTITASAGADGIKLSVKARRAGAMIEKSIPKEAIVEKVSLTHFRLRGLSELPCLRVCVTRTPIWARTPDHKPCSRCVSVLFWEEELRFWEEKYAQEQAEEAAADRAAPRPWLRRLMGLFRGVL